MLRVLTVAVALALAVLFGRAALSTGDFTVESARIIEAPPKQIMPFLDDFHSWAVWWPPERQDPGIARRISGAPRGVGALYQWTTDGPAGTGHMAIVTAQPDLLRIAIDQSAPRVTTGTIEFRLEAGEDGTRVLAKIAGHNSLSTRLRHPLGNDADTLDSQLDDALTYIKLAVESTDPA